MVQIGMEWLSGKTRSAPVPDPGGTPGRVRKLPHRFQEFWGRAGTKPAEDRARKLAPSHFGALRTRGLAAIHGAAPTHHIFASVKDRADMREMSGSRLCSLSSFLAEYSSLAQLAAR